MWMVKFIGGVGWGLLSAVSFSADFAITQGCQVPKVFVMCCAVASQLGVGEGLRDVVILRGFLGLAGECRAESV